MNEYDICTDMVGIIAGTSETYSTAYIEASKSVSNDSSKSLKYLKNFITSIESLQSKDVVKDQRISASKGDITAFQGYDNIQKSIEFVNKYASGAKDIKHINGIVKSLNDYKTLYVDGYTHNISLLKSEYECGVYLVVTGLVYTMCSNTDVVTKNDSLAIVKKSGTTGGTISKMLKEFDSQLSNKNHREYLEQMIKLKMDNGVSTHISESTSFLEASVEDTIKLVSDIWNNVTNIGKFGWRAVNAVKNSIFGIVPLIRSVMYLRYKRKADMIRELDTNVAFIQQNIERLEKRTNISEAKKRSIIKKQQAIAEQYQKKAEKLRAQLIETEKDVTAEIKKEDPKMSTSPSDDGDFVLEGINLSELAGDLFAESQKNKHSDINTGELKSPLN